MQRRFTWAVGCVQRTSLRRCIARLLLGMAVLLTGSPAEAVITKLTPLREVLSSQQLIFTVKVDKIDPDKPALVLKVDEDLKGKAPFRKLPINLTADSEGQRQKDTEKLLKRLAPDLSLVVFAGKREKRYTAFAYTNGSWFQIIGQVGDDPAGVRWSFTHCEPYLRRTFKGTTAELQEIVRDGLAGKKQPPDPNPKEPPGLGPELKEEKTPKKKALSIQPSANSTQSVPVFAVIPTFVIIGPLALLAALFPAVFGGLALFMRRWLVLLSIASLNSTLYLVHTWFRGYFKDTWWGSPFALWMTLALVTLLGVIWSWWRQRSLIRANAEVEAQLPPRSERFVLWTTSLTGLVFVVYCLLKGTLFDSPWKELLIIWVVAWVGTLYMLCLRFLAGVARPESPKGVAGLIEHALRGLRACHTERIMLGACVLACGGLAALSLPRQAGETVKVVWAFEAVDRGAILSSPRVDGDRVYVAAIHSAGFSTFGAVYCLDRDTGKELWKFDDEGGLQQVFSTPFLAEGKIYFGEGLHENQGCKFYCLDASSGRKLWDFETASHTESSPCVAGGKVFFGAGDDGIYCCDAATGARRWQFCEPLHVDANPTVVGARLYAGSGVSRTHKTTEIFCLDTEDGHVHWRQRTDLPVWGSPALDGDHVLFGLGNGRMDQSVEPPEQPAGAILCVEASTGRQAWRYDVGDGVLLKPALDQQHVYFGCRDRHCYCLNRADGSLCWKADLSSPVVAAPALLDKHLYVVATEGQVYCLDTASGKSAWMFDTAQYSQTKPQLMSSPAVVAHRDDDGESRRIYFGAGLTSALSSGAVLYCLQDNMR